MSLFPKSSFQTFSEKHLTRFDSPDAARMAYPNIYAEYEARIQSNWFTGLCGFHECLNTTRETAAAIMRGAEPIGAALVTFQRETVMPYRACARLGYLLDKRLALMPLQPWRRERYVKRLSYVYSRAMKDWPAHFNEAYPAHARGVIEALEAGEPVTYANYQVAIANCWYMIGRMDERRKEYAARESAAKPMIIATNRVGAKRKFPIISGIITDEQLDEIRAFASGSEETEGAA